MRETSSPRCRNERSPCHLHRCSGSSAKEKPNLTTQAAVQANKGRIMSVAVTGTKMPASGSLAVEERQLLGEWLACGAP